ncbi:cell wall-binding repeat-containing protein [Quadrisphaera sp. KR29]|uniref:cell wall-binding repeat-containing protein n=1 Tax=Quadrisphaera sp. KR29 TaxID=3461391 RepID=UPI0040444C63
MVLTPASRLARAVAAAAVTATTAVLCCVPAAPASAAPAYEVEPINGWTDASGVAIAADGSAYVVDSGGEGQQGSIFVVDAEGSISDLVVDGLVSPSGIAVSGSTLYVADTGNHRVVSLRTDGTGLRRVAGLEDAVAGAPSPGRADASPLRSPSGVAVDARGDLYVADTGNNQVEKITTSTSTPQLSVVAGTGLPAAEVPGPAVASPLRAPEEVSVSAAGDVLVADTGNRAVARISAGTLTTSPTGAVTRAVAATGTAGALTARGSAVVTLGSQTPLATAAGPVQGLAVAPDGTIYAAAGSEVLVLVPSEGSLSAPRITTAPPTRAAKGQPLTIPFAATGLPAPRWSVLTGTVSGLSRVSIDAATGVLTATAGTASTASVTVRAENSRGHDDRVVSLALGSPPPAPSAVTATAGPTSATLTWLAPSGAPSPDEAVTGWVVTPSRGGAAATPVTVSGTATSTTVTGLVPGVATTFTVAATNAFGTGPASTASAPVLPWASIAQPPTGVTRLEGAGRIQTAVRTSQQLFPASGSARAVVLSSSTTYADALAGARLASAEGAPLLLTEGGVLSASVAAEVKRVLAVPPAASTGKTGSGTTTSGKTGTTKGPAPSSPGTVFLLGGTTALSADVEAALKALSPSITVVRLRGTDRYATAVAVAAQVDVDAPVDDGPIYVASGTNYPDGLAVSALAARTGGVVLLSEGGRLPAATSGYLSARDPGGDRVVPVGGPAAAAVGARGAARALVGADRYDTARLVAARFTAGAGQAPVRTVGLATGENWPDALSGAAAMGGLGGPLLLTPTSALSPAVGAAVASLPSRPGAGLVFGGTSVVAAPVSSGFAGLMGG